MQRGIDESGIGIWDLDLGTHAMFWSGATRRLFGVSPDEPVSYELFLSRLQPEDRARTELAIQRSAASGCKFDIQCRIRETPEGSRWVRARGGIVTDTDGVPRRLSGVVLDIHDQKRLE
ncbi:MAG: PAS domain-containing protein, partial [Rhizobiales bacterium]|nr:PAS domain-containing protein [Hyphomicrobiales bacterium]